LGWEEAELRFEPVASLTSAFAFDYFLLAEIIKVKRKRYTHIILEDEKSKR
jgi:hypothetical protein